MHPLVVHPPENHQDVLNRLVAACQIDERILAALIGGSYAQGKVDPYSDLDLFLITTDQDYEDFLVSKAAFLRLLGEPLFLEDFGTPNGCQVIFSNGTEAEIYFYPEREFKDLYEGPHQVLLDKTGILIEQVFPFRGVDPVKQAALLRNQLGWFWHDLSHFIKAMGRGQLWFAYGELEILRQNCVKLVRLRYNFSDPYLDEAYFKVDEVIPVALLAPLKETICLLEYHAMLQSSRAILHFFQTVAPALSEEHGMPYPVDLEQMMIRHLDALNGAGRVM